MTPGCVLDGSGCPLDSEWDALCFALSHWDDGSSVAPKPSSQKHKIRKNEPKECTLVAKCSQISTLGYYFLLVVSQMSFQKNALEIKIKSLLTKITLCFRVKCWMWDCSFLFGMVCSDYSFECVSNSSHMESWGWNSFRNSTFEHTHTQKRDVF